MASEVVDLFTELAALPSPPGEERAVADVVIGYLRDLGLSVDEDDAGPKVGSNIGNVYCRLEATDGGNPIFLCAHLDTVPPEGPIEPVIEDGVVRNAAGTILGADNKSAVAAMLEGARRVLAENRPHGGIELLFTPKEEVGLLGAAAFDHERLQARLGYVYDQAAPIGDVILGAPYSQAMQVRFHGRAAHSGMYPEEGRSAIAAAARAIAVLRLGRIDEETTANVGIIQGGTAGNIVRSGARSTPRRAHTTSGSSLSWCRRWSMRSRSRPGSRTARSRRRCRRATGLPLQARRSRCADRARRRSNAAGTRLRTRSAAAPADANVFNERGLTCLNLANGMQDIHKPDERITVADLEGMVDVTLALVDAARSRC